MKPIFDGVYINQILFRAGTVSAATLAPDEFSPSERTSGFLRPLCPFAEWPFGTELKRGSIFIRRFLMKHFKCMEPTIVPSRNRASLLFHLPLTQSPSSSDRDSPFALSPACLTLKRYESFPSVLPCATHARPACS